MYTVIKLAALSAALAAAAVTMLDGHHPAAPSAARFLTDRIEAAPVPSTAERRGSSAIVPASRSCAGAWPYRDTCGAGEATTAGRVVRVISPDRVQIDSSGRDWAHSSLAQR
jgi:hypothetical protein